MVIWALREWNREAYSTIKSNLWKLSTMTLSVITKSILMQNVLYLKFVLVWWSKWKLCAFDRKCKCTEFSPFHWSNLDRTQTHKYRRCYCLCSHPQLTGQKNAVYWYYLEGCMGFTILIFQTLNFFPVSKAPRHRFNIHLLHGGPQTQTAQSTDWRATAQRQTVSRRAAKSSWHSPRSSHT